MEDAKELCNRFGFIFTEPSELAWRRRRCGKGFSYLDAAGKAVSDRAHRERIKRLAIPPAWEDVFIAERADAHLQAIGRDAKGRLQYRYHPDWTEVRAKAKEGRLLRFGKALPRIRHAVNQALVEPALTRRKMVAAVVRLIDRALLRPGYEEYAGNDGGRGASTLLTSDVELNGDLQLPCGLRPKAARKRSGSSRIHL